MTTVQKVGAHLREALGVPYVGLRVVGVDVPHAHVQIIPFTEASELDYHPDMTAEPDHSALAALAEKIRL
jgi:histidine triad (HIT) family protein